MVGLTDRTADEPIVSIGVAVYNGSKTLGRAFESLTAQDYPHIEIVICDDGSTDGSVELCQEFSERHPNCRFTRNPSRLGIARNYNELISRASGKYFFFADQDDRRDPTFVSRCVEVLEGDAEAVLCHSHTGVEAAQDTSVLYHINTLNSVDGVGPVVLRYWRFLRHYTDTSIYGLIRLDALRRTAGWQEGLGSSNRLLFELLLLGTFKQVPDILYWYSTQGLWRGNAEEFARVSGGRSLPKFYIPFLALAWAQTTAIVHSKWSLAKRSALLLALWTHVALTNAGKAIYRFVRLMTGGRVPESLERFCTRLVYSTADIQFVTSPDDDPDHYPDAFLLRRPEKARTQH